MKYLAICLILMCGISACSSSNFNGYIPVDEEHLFKYENRVEGSFTISQAYSYFKPLGEESSLSIRMISSSEENKVYVSIFVKLPFKSTLRFLNDTITIINKDGGRIMSERLQEFRLSVTGTNGQKGNIRYFKPLDTLAMVNVERISQNPLVSSVAFEQRELPVCITLKLPTFLLDGKEFEISPIEFIKMTDGFKSEIDCK